MSRGVYIASPWGNRDQALVIRSTLQELGVRVTSRWLDGRFVELYDTDGCRSESLMDLTDIDLADVLLLVTSDRFSGTGHNVEFGYAYGRNKLTVLAGPRKSVFHALASREYPSWDEALHHIGDWT